MDKWLEGLKPVVEHQELKVPYRYSMGATASRFFTEIRDNKEIMGIKCSKCSVVYVPPRSTCGRCFSPLNDWVGVSDRGTLETYTRVRYDTPTQPVAAPFFYGVIKLDGADTGLPHLIGDTNGKEPRIGMCLQAVFKEERAGNMLDILYFKPIEEPKGKKGEKAKRGKGKKLNSRVAEGKAKRVKKEKVKRAETKRAKQRVERKRVKAKAKGPGAKKGKQNTKGKKK